MLIHWLSGQGSRLRLTSSGAWVQIPFSGPVCMYWFVISDKRATATTRFGGY